MEAHTYKVYRKVKNQLIKIPGVVGVAYTRDEIIVYATTPRVRYMIQPYIEGVPVKIHIVGGFIAHGTKAA